MNNINLAMETTKITKTLLIIYFSTFLAIRGIAQDMERFYASPSASEMERYGIHPVTMFTGTLEVSVPLYELRTRNLTLPIALNYRTNGFLVNKAASNVGFDWSLSCGGYITRTVKGFPDDSGQFTQEEFPVSLDSFSHSALTAAQKDQIMYFFAGWNEEMDTEPDMFTFSVNGYSGQFYVDNDNQVVLVPYQKIKIERPVNSGTFTITTPDGIRYLFQASEVSGETFRSSVTLYCLRKIIHPEGDEINFYYKQSGSYFYKSDIFQIVSSYTAGGYGGSGPCPYTPPNSSVPEATRVHVRPLILDSVVAKGQGKVIFQTDNDRLDLPERRIKGVEVYDINGTLIKSIDLHHHSQNSTLYSNSVATQNSRGPQFNEEDVRYRMFLDSLVFRGKNGQSVTRYKFSYNDIGQLPIRCAYAQDHWGYFNGASNYNLFPNQIPPAIKSASFPGLSTNADRQANWTYAKKGTLSQITYPTGGYSIFEYSHHTNEVDTEVGGIRISRQTDYEANGQTLGITNYTYFEGRTNGYYAFTNQYYIPYQFSTICQIPGQGSGSTGYPPTSTTFSVHTMRSRGMYVPSMSFVHSVGYQRVRKDRGVGAGWEEHGFSVSFDDYYPVNLYGQFPLFPYPLINQGWDAGRKKFEKYYDTNGLLKRSVDYEYKEDSIYNGDQYFVAVQQFYPRLPTFGYNFIGDYFNVGKYAILSRWKYLSSSTEKVFDGDGQNPIITKTDYYHESFLHTQLTRKKTVDSKGDVMETRYYYPQDYNSTASNFSVLAANYIINKPVDIRNYHAGKLVDGQQRSYNDFGQQLNVFTAETGVGEIPFNASVPYSFPSRINYEYHPTTNTVASIKYDGDLRTSYLWGYNNQYPVAEVKNSLQADIAYAGFESDGKGNWTYSGATTIDDMAPTGRRVYHLAGGGLQKTGLTVGRKYLLTYWSKGGAPTVAGSSGSSVSAATPMRSSGGWTQYSRVVSLSTAVTVSGTSGRYVDDVRLHPIEASMDSYTYDPLVGMTSRTDASGNVFHYRYDDFGRLEAVKDLNGHVVEDYRYHYLNQ